MKTLKRFVLSLSTLLLISGVALSTAAWAEDSSGSVVGNPPRSSEPEKPDANDNSDSDSTSDSGTMAKEFRELAQQKIQQERKTVKAHTKAEREKACVARRASLAKRMGNTVTQAKKHKEVIDKIYVKVKAFQVSKNIDVSTAAVDTGQADAQASINALQSLDVNVDCTSQDVAASISAFQQAVKNTRDTLKDYRADLVNLIKAIKGASSSSGSSSTNSNNQ